MKLTSLLAATTLALGGVAASAAPAGAAGTTTSGTCTDGHWPASVQGKPSSFHADGPAGTYLWHDSAGWHLRVTHANHDRLAFSGRVTSSAKLDEAPHKVEGKDYVAMTADHTAFVYRFTNFGGIDGVDWKTRCAKRLTFSLQIAGHTAPTGRVFIGAKNVHPLEVPFSVTRVS